LSLRIFRLHSGRRAASDYGGTLVNAQRWNPAGTPVLYASSNLSLCCLEVLVHMKKDRIPVDYVWSTALLPVAPEQFDNVCPVESPDRTRTFGKWWIERVSAVAIAVPSVIIPNTSTDFNVLLNPLHGDYVTVPWEMGGYFGFDSRLFVTENA
jgi:RES domain-containing protein